MDLRDLRLTLSRHWVVMLMVFNVFVLIGLAASYLPQQQFRTSTTVVLDLPVTEENIGSIQQVNFLLPALRELTQSRALRDRAADKVPVELRVPQARIEALTDESVMRIVATAGSPESAQAWANAVGEQLIEERGDNELIELARLDPAPLKPKAISPRVEPTMVAAVVLGAIAAIFAALAADRIKRAFDTNRAVRDRLGTTILGEIPKMKRSERKLPIIRLLDGPQSSVDLVSAFEGVRTNVEFLMAGTDIRRIAVVSLRRQTGKSTVAGGLSCALAKVGRPVTAVEADLHHPTLAEQFDIRPGYGIGDMAGAAVEEVHPQSTRYDHLTVLSAGIPVGRAADVVSTTLPGVLDLLDEPGRLTIIDSPPLRGAPESSIIVTQARQVILVVNNSSTDYSSLSDAIERIGESGGVLLGIVINRVPRGRLQRDSYPSSKASRRATPIGGSHANPQEPPPQAAAVTEITKVEATDVSSAGGVTTSTSDALDF
jgi:Mrp family chromosome partitioning ATPase/capsular polysaccharide biosynthesis protein